MEPHELNGILEALIAAGPRLIGAGITQLSVGGVEVHLAPTLPGAGPLQEKPAPRGAVDPLNDPSTYQGGHVPRFASRLPKEGADYPLAPIRHEGRR